MHFKVPIMLCSNSPNIKQIMLIVLHQLCFHFTVLCRSVHITNLFSLLFMIALATHFYAQDRQATTTLDLIAH